MNKGYALMLVVLLALVTATGAWAGDMTAGQWDIHAGIWAPTISGNVSTTGSSLSLNGDLGLKNSSNIVGGVKYRYNSDTTFGLEYYGLNTNGSNTLANNVTFAGKTYLANNAITSNMTFNVLELTYERALYHSEGGGTFNYLLGLKNVNGSIGVNAPTYNSSVSGNIIMPEIGLSGRANLSDQVGLHARITWLGGASGSVNGNFTDIGAGVDYSFNPSWALNLDYRIININGTTGNESGNLQLGGIYATVNFIH